MARFYKVLKADPLGDAWTPNQPNAKPLQTFWCQVEGEELAVSISKQVGNTLTPGQHVYGDLMKATSQRGTNYWKFKSAQVPEGAQRPADTPAQATAQAATGSQPNVSEQIPGWAVMLYNMVEYIYNEMKKMDTSAAPTSIKADELPTSEPATPVDAETQATLDEIFTPEDAPEPEGK